MEPVIRNYQSVDRSGGGPVRLISLDDSPVTCTMTYSAIEPGQTSSHHIHPWEPTSGSLNPVLHRRYEAHDEHGRIYRGFGNSATGSRGGWTGVVSFSPGLAGDASNPVDGHDVPVPHFGLLLSVDDFHALAGRLRQAEVDFVIEPYLRFAGLPGEQWTMFLRDPAGNAWEFKAFKDDAQVFAT